MDSTRPPTQRRRFSPLPPTALGLAVTDRQEALHKLFSYVSVLPEQFYSPRPSLAHGRPEAALMRAVLVEGLECFQKGLVDPGRRAQRLAHEAEAWLFSEDASWPFSFTTICAVLGLEPKYIRRGLKRWRQDRPPTAPRQQSHAVERQRRLAA